MAMIRQRGDKWQATVRRKGYPLQIKSFELQKDAVAWARQQERAMDSGTWLDRSEAEQTTLAQVLERYGKEVTPTKRGHVVEACRIEALKRSSLGKYSVAAITGGLVSIWRDSRLKEVSGTTVVKELGLLSNVFNVAMREWGFGLTSNPVSLVRRPAQNPARDRVLTAAEREALVIACGQSRNPWLLPAFLFNIGTGARRGEQLALRWADVDLVRCTAKVSGKTGARTIPLPDDVVKMLATLPRSIDGRVFPITASALQQAFERSVERSGIAPFVWHDGRHVALSNYAAMGLSILELCAISGHSSTDMLRRYVSIDAADLAVTIRTKQSKAVA